MVIRFSHQKTNSSIVNNEIGAYLFGTSVYYYFNKGFGADMPWSNTTKEGTTYGKSMTKLLYNNFDFSTYKTAIDNFKKGSSVNTTSDNKQGMYKDASLKTVLKNPLIKKFYPLYPKSIYNEE